jgi:hypothetical protein
MKLLTLKNFFVASAVVAAFFGVILATLPAQLAAVFGVTLDDDGAFSTRYVGVAWLGYALLNWLAREAGAQAQRLALSASLVPTALGIFATLWGVGSGVGNGLLLFWVVLFAAFAIGEVYYLFPVAGFRSAPASGTPRT